MQLTINMTVDDARAAAATEPQSAREVAAAALRDLASQLEADAVRSSFIGQVVDADTGQWIGGFHVILQEG